MNDKLKKLIEEVNKKAGGSVLKVASSVSDYGVIDTPFDTINTLIGGIPLARFCTIAGPEHTGKGAFLLQVIAHQQSKDPNFIVLWTDAENSFEPSWASQLGVDLDRVILQKYNRTTDTMEKILDQSLRTIKESNAINMWVIDSLGALVPKDDLYDSKEDEKSLEGMKMLNLQKKLGEFYRKANTMIGPDGDYKGCAVVLVGQIYTVPDAHTSLTEVRGGNAVKHWAHLRLVLRRGPRSEWPEPTDIIGIDGNKYKAYPGWSGRFKVEKTRLNKNEGKEVALQFIHGKGFDSFHATINAAFGLGIFQRSGPQYSCESFQTKWKGKDALIQYFTNNKQEFDKLREIVNNTAVSNHLQVSEEIEELQ